MYSIATVNLSTHCTYNTSLAIYWDVEVFEQLIDETAIVKSEHLYVTSICSTVFILGPLQENNECEEMACVETYQAKIEIISALHCTFCVPILSFTGSLGGLAWLCFQKALHVLVSVVGQNNFPNIHTKSLTTLETFDMWIPAAFESTLHPYHIPLDRYSYPVVYTGTTALVDHAESAERVPFSVKSA